MSLFSSKSPKASSPAYGTNIVFAVASSGPTIPCWLCPPLHISFAPFAPDVLAILLFLENATLVFLQLLFSLYWILFFHIIHISLLFFLQVSTQMSLHLGLPWLLYLKQNTHTFWTLYALYIMYISSNKLFIFYLQTSHFPVLVLHVCKCLTGTWHIICSPHILLNGWMKSCWAISDLLSLTYLALRSWKAITF